MPHDKAHVHSLTNTGGVVLDRRRALAIAPVGKFDSCRPGNPLKILKTRVPSVDIDASTFVGMYPKIHWTQLASNGASSQPVQCHNGSQAAGHSQNAPDVWNINRRELKVILTDVLQTKAGRSYLSSCGLDPSLKHQSEWKGVRLCERLSAQQRDRKEGSPSCWEPMNSSVSTTNARYTRQRENNDLDLAKATVSPLSKKLRRIDDSPKQSEPSTSDKKESFSEELAIHYRKDNKFCTLEDSDCARPLPSEGTDVAAYEHKLAETPRRTPSCFTLRRHKAGCSSQQDTSEAEMQESSEEDGDWAEEEQRRAERCVNRNGEMPEDWGGARRSVLRLSAGAVGSRPQTGMAKGEVPRKCSGLQSPLNKTILNSNRVEVRKTSKPNTAEPIVLSSEEEEEKAEGSSALPHPTPEGAKVPHTPQRPALEKKKIPGPQAHTSNMRNQALSCVGTPLRETPMMELQFSALHMGGLSTSSAGLVKIMSDTVMILLKGPSGTEVKAFLPTAHLRFYSVWDGTIVQDSELAKNRDALPPSLLLLWLSEAQARRLANDLSAIQPGKCPAEGSMCVLLCLSEVLNGVEGALLASIMDIVGLNHRTSSLLSPLSPTESLTVLQSEHDSPMLQLLRPRAKTHATATEASATVPAAKESEDSDVQPNSIYTLCHSRSKGTYSVSMVPKPAEVWDLYRHSGPPRRLIQFPPPPSKGAITVSTEDLECLDSGEFLNDVIIDFYLKYLLVQKAPHSSVRRSHVFSSFFYKQLTRRDNANEDSTSTPTQLRRHQRVKTWTRHVDIFDKDFLFVPVNQEAHWYLVVICFPGMDQPQYVKREGPGLVEDASDACSEAQEPNPASAADGGQLPDEASSSAPGPPDCTEKTCKRQTVCKRPCILIMDSLKLSVHERIFKLLREYLQAEWEVKRGGYRDFSAERVVGSHCKVPLQDNSSDCGLYLLQYAESFLQDPVVHFDLPLKLGCWFPRQQVREKREEIRDLVLHLYRFQRNLEDRTDIGNGVQ